MSDLEDTFIEALGDALALKDLWTESHSKRVTAYTIALARAAGLSNVPGDDTNIKNIARGAFLHDIGKIGIPDEILYKRGALTREEQEVRQQHCVQGFHLLRKVSFLSEAAEIAFTHHERYDGNGYPSGLSANQIPVGARLVAIADALDMITSDRPNMHGLTFKEARNEITKGSGTHFDPKVVEIYLKLPPELLDELRTAVMGEPNALI